MNLYLYSHIHFHGVHRDKFTCTWELFLHGDVSLKVTKRCKTVTLFQHSKNKQKYMEIIPLSSSAHIHVNYLTSKG